MRWIPWKEVEAKLMEKPGFAEACEQAQREFDEEIAIYGTIGNPKPQPRPVFARASTKRKPRSGLAEYKNPRDLSIAGGCDRMESA